MGFTTQSATKGPEGSASPYSLSWRQVTVEAGSRIDPEEKNRDCLPYIKVMETRGGTLYGIPRLT